MEEHAHDRNGTETSPPTSRGPRSDSELPDWLGFGRGSCRVVASLMFWGTRAFGSLLAGLPVATLLEAHVSGYANGEHELFRAGGVLLLDALLQQRQALGAALDVAVTSWVVGLCVGFAAMAFVLGALVGARHSTLESALGRTAHAFPRVLAVSVLGWATRVALACVGFLLISLTVNLSDALDNERTRGLCVTASAVVALTLVALVQPWCDLARSRATANNESVWRSSGWAWRLVRRHSRRTFTRWAAAAGAGLACLATATAVTPMFLDGDPSALQTTAMIFIQQLGFAGATAWRLAWLSKAAAIVREDRRVGLPGS